MLNPVLFFYYPDAVRHSKVKETGFKPLFLFKCTEFEPGKVACDINYIYAIYPVFLFCDNYPYIIYLFPCFIGDQSKFIVILPIRFKE